MPRYRVDIGGTADVYRTLWIDAKDANAAKKRAKKIASGDEDLQTGEHAESWKQSTTPRRLYVSSVDKD